MRSIRWEGQGDAHALRLAACRAAASLASLLFRTARRVDDVEALTSGNPKRMERRVKNMLVGRALGRGGFWRWLWK
jgi:hypothetical protein